MEFLEQPAMAFVRLNEAVLLESVLEVPVPVRFIFVLLGPSQSNMDYHEIGRSFSTLMSDKVSPYTHFNYLITFYVLCFKLILALFMHFYKLLNNRKLKKSGV